MSGLEDPVAAPEGAQILVNGQARAWREGWTVADLVAEFSAAGGSERPGSPGLAVERNCEVVRRADHARTQLAPGDRIELVRLVGGG